LGRSGVVGERCLKELTAGWAAILENWPGGPGR